MFKNIIIALLVFLLPSFSSLAAKPLKTGLSYNLIEQQEIQLRVTQIPKKYPWLEKTDDGKTLGAKQGAIIVAENISDLEIKDAYGKTFLLPSGSRFYARVAEKQPAKRFWRKSKMKLDFFRLELNDGSQFEEHDSLTGYKGKTYDGRNFIEPNIKEASLSTEIENNYRDGGKNNFVDYMKNSASTLGYTAAGALAAPLLVFSITSAVSNVLSLGVLSNPYILGGSAAVGAGAGFIYGVQKKGKELKLEPGTEITINLDDPWYIASQLQRKEVVDKMARASEKHKHAINPKFKLEILEVKKSKDSFGDKALKLSLAYENKTGEELRYTSFQLIDSMGKAYSPELKSIDREVFGELPDKYQLDLYFTVDFLKTSHELQVLRFYDRKVLARAAVVLL